MTTAGNTPAITVATDLNDYFEGRVSEVFEKQKKEASQEGKKYLASLLAHFALAENFQFKYTKDWDGEAKGAGDVLSGDLNSADLFMAVAHFADKQPSLLLKHTADYSLFMTGFFSGGRKSRWFNSKHFKEIGIKAYDTLATRKLSQDLKSIFREISFHFIEYTHVISEIQLDTEANHQESVNNLFESWIRGGNQLALEVLLRKGLVPINPENKVPN